MVNSFFTSLGDEVILIRKVLPFALLWTKWGFSLSFTKKMENLAGCSPSQILFGFSGQKQVQIRVKRAYYSKTLAVDAGMFNTSSRSLIIYFMHSVLFFRLWSRTTIKSPCSKDHLLWKTPSSFGEDPCGMLSWRVRCKLYDNSLTLQSCQKIYCLNIPTFPPAKCKRCWSLLNQADVEVRFMSFTLQNNTFFCPESASHLNCKACAAKFGRLWSGDVWYLKAVFFVKKHEWFRGFDVWLVRVHWIFFIEFIERNCFQCFNVIVVDVKEKKPFTIMLFSVINVDLLFDFKRNAII